MSIESSDPLQQQQQQESASTAPSSKSSDLTSDPNTSKTSTQPSSDQSISEPESFPVYVSELDQSVNEADLFQIFSKYGDILSIRVARDVKRRSIGYAYVNFTSPEYATAALEHDFKFINNKPCRVTRFERDPSLRISTPKSTVFIRNLDTAVTVDELKAAFESYGKIVGAKIAVQELQRYNNYNNRKQENNTEKANEEDSTTSASSNKKDTPPTTFTVAYGYVEFESPDSAAAALKNANGMTLGSRNISVSPHISRRPTNASNPNHPVPPLVKLQPSPQSIAEAEATFTNLFVKNIDPSVTSEEFEQLFAKYGPIVSHFLPVDEQGSFRGFGFVNFQTHAGAVAAIKALNDYKLKDKNLVVTRAMQRHEREEEIRQQYEASRLKRLAKYSGTNLYIKGLDVKIDDDELRNLFAPYGTITSAKVMTDDSGKSRGFGFVCYSNSSEAQQAISEMNNAQVKGNTLYVTIAQKREHHNTKPQFTTPIPIPFFNPQIPAVIPPTIIPDNKSGSPNSNDPNSPNASNLSPSNSNSPSNKANNGRIPQFSPQFYNPYYLGGIPGQAWGPGMPPMASGNPNGPQPQLIFPNYPYQGLISPLGPNPGMQYIKNKTGNRMNGKPNQGQSPNNQHIRNNNNMRKSSGNGGNKGYYNNGHYNNHYNNNNNNRYNNSNSNNNQSNNNSSQYHSSSLSAALASAPNPEAERQVIGEALYPKVQRHPAVNNDNELTAKLTGMMLDIDNKELLKWIDEDALLNARIQEAYDQYMEFLGKKSTDKSDDAEEESSSKKEDDKQSTEKEEKK